MIEALRNAFKLPDLRRRMLYTVLILVIFRMASNIPVPGVDRQALSAVFSSASASAASQFAGLLDLLSGGAVSNFSVLAAGVYPYVTAQIVVQLLVPIFPKLEQQIQEEGEGGRRKMNQWVFYLTVPLAALYAFGQAQLFQAAAVGSRPILPNFGWGPGRTLPTITILLTMTAGTMVAVWLGELISEYGVPNQGLSLIIFAGIVSRIPVNLYSLVVSGQSVAILLALMAVILALTIFAIIFVQQGRRNVPVLFPGRRVGNRMSMPVRSNLPLMINLAGMIPLIFAQTILSLPAILAQFFINSKTEWLANFAASMQRTFSPTSIWYVVIYFSFVLLLTFFYTEVLFEQQNYGDSLKRQGAQIPGVVRGAATQRYLNRVQRRITLVGALFLAIVATIPYILQIILPPNIGSNLFLVSASGLIIVVGVVRDTFNIIETELKIHGYDESLLKG